MGAVALTVVGAAAAWFLLRPHRTEAKPEPTRITSVLPLEPFVVNLADEEPKVFLRVGIELGLAGAEKKAKEGKVEEPTALVRDSILGVLMSKRSDDLVTADGKQKLKEELLRVLNNRAPELRVHEVYYTEFLLQR